MYSIRRTPSAGLGVFATLPIPRGTRIFSEPALLSIPAAAAAASSTAAAHPTGPQSASSLYTHSLLLSPSALLTFRALSAHTTPALSLLRWSQAVGYTFRALVSSSSSSSSGPRFPAGWWNLKQHVQTLAIFRSNSFALPGASLALFPTIARINHSCVPNAQGNYHPPMDRFNVHATRDIKVGEEVTLNYLSENGSLRESRMGRLREGYGFECACPACASQVGEARRVEMRKTLREFAEGVDGGVEKSVARELETVKKFIDLFEGEKIKGRELASLYLEAARLNEELGDMEEALSCAKKGVELDGDCLGVDHPQYLKDLEVVKRLSR